MPDLENLIKAMECSNWHESICENCPYGYGHIDDSGDHAFWCCDDDKVYNDAISWLKLIQHLINDNGGH